MRHAMAGCLVGAVLVGSIAVSAHHGTNASYDSTKPTTVTGTVTRFSFRNPHCFIEFDARNEKGELVHWVAEMNSPTVLRAAGLTTTSIQAGDQVTLTLNPSRAGTPAGVVNRSHPVVVNGKQVLGPAGGATEN